MTNLKQTYLDSQKEFEEMWLDLFVYEDHGYIADRLEIASHNTKLYTALLDSFEEMVEGEKGERPVLRELSDKRVVDITPILNEALTTILQKIKESRL